MPLEVMGFCGADDSVDPRLLIALSNAYSFVEWGVLFRPDKEGQPRYASAEWVERLSAARRAAGGTARLAAHLCSSRVDEILRADASFVKRLRDLGFGRVQVNATAVNGVNMSLVNDSAHARLLEVCSACPELEFIVQHNAETMPLWKPILANGPPPNMSILFDESKGTGQLSGTFAQPPHGVRCGYAGGLGPANIAASLEAVLASAGASKGLWVDMESSLRTRTAEGEDVFDVSKCFACAMAAVDGGILAASK